jgi:hypothetical protein
MSVFIFEVNIILEHYAFICHLQHTYKSIPRRRPRHTVCAILKTKSWQQSGDPYVLLLWNRRTFRSLYTTKQATEFINLHCQHAVFQSKECCIHVKHDPIKRKICAIHYKEIFGVFIPKTATNITIT